MKNYEVIDVFNAYNEALSNGDFELAFNYISNDIVWHMGGRGPLSGEVVGKELLGMRFAEFSKRSNGTFKVVNHWIASNGNLLAASVTSIADNEEKGKLNSPGIDIYRIEKGKIQEVWTFAEKQSEEDEYWK